jgi:hypothetical protein
MDRGMSSPETLRLLGQDHRRYILGTPKSLLKKFEAELAKTDWEKVRDGLEVKRCSSPFGNEQEIFILCRSADRQAKEKAIRECFVKRIEIGLRSLQKNCASGRLASVEQTERHIGRLLERHRRAAKFFTIAVKEQNEVDKRLLRAAASEAATCEPNLDGAKHLRTVPPAEALKIVQMKQL